MQLILLMDIMRQHLMTQIKKWKAIEGTSHVLDHCILTFFRS
jgi:hypothetical protein